MLGFLLFYFIGKYFYKLAEDHQENKWLYAIIGVAVYYAGTGVGGLILGFVFLLTNINFDWDNTVLTSLIAIPFGLCADYLFYIVLRKMWSKKENAKDEINEIGIENDNL
jgi:uncharacterized membrane protein YfcA